MYRAVRIVTLLILIKYAAGSLLVRHSLSPDAPFVSMVANLFGLAFWAFLIWKAWSRPRSWGFGFGILLLCTIPFHFYLWSLAMKDPSSAQFGFSATPLGFVYYEIEPALAGLGCIALRWLTPSPTTAPVAEPS